ncbi:MAG: repressor LexA [Candidatus Aminicenantes bacterium]|nr:repressor LexA [Candidatus Aminicenantes bacterium]
MVNTLRRELTGRQREILRAVEEFVLEHGFFPTVRQLGEKVGISNPSAVFKHLRSLKKKGYLSKSGGKAVLAGFPSYQESRTRVPLVGLVPAGPPREVFDLSDEMVEVPDWMVGRRQGSVFCIRVEGKSMVDAYIDDGDRVLVERTDTARSGEFIVALLDDGSVTLKRLKLEKGKIFLVPENPDLRPITVSELRILGRVIGVLRKY